ncbi:MAG: PAS domain S-box protein [Desulfobacteraceae bacterium]|nr:PAS domain S-box protein [Desulfobacteraceae bacterium]
MQFQTENENKCDNPTASKQKRRSGIMTSAALFKDPIKRKVIFLIIMFIILGLTLIGIEEPYLRKSQKHNSELENLNAQQSLGKILLNRLLKIEKDVILLTTVDDINHLANIKRTIDLDIKDVSSLLTVMQNGGLYRNILPVNKKYIKNITENIRINHISKKSQLIATQELWPKLDTIKTLVDNIEKTVRSSLTEQDPSFISGHKRNTLQLHNKLEKNISGFNQNANKIYYHTSYKIELLQNQMPKNRAFFEKTRYGVMIAIMMSGLWLCIDTLKQISRILKDRQTYESQLLASRKSVEQILEALPVGIALISKDKKIRQMNKAAMNILGLSDKNALIGQTCGTLLCSIETGECPMNLPFGTTFSNETYFRSPSGHKPAVLRKTISLKINNEPVVLEAFIDISERKFAEQALIENQHFINKILEAVTVGIVVVDATTHTIVDVNPAAVKMIGAHKESLIGADCGQWICPAFSGKCPITGHGHKVSDSEQEIKTVDGRNIPVIKNVAMTMLNGRIHLVESFIDISKLKRAEEKVLRLNSELEQRVIERTAQLEKTNDDLKTALRDLKETQSFLLQSEKMASIGQLAAGIAHEINNPVGFVRSNLNSISDYLSDLMTLIKAYESFNEVFSKTPPDQDFQDFLNKTKEIKMEIDLDFILEDLENVVSESMEGLNRIANIVADLKNFAHMDGDEADWADINSGIESTLNIVWNELKYKANVTKDLGQIPQVKCYPQRINQVIMNLLVNAAQSIEKRGDITVKTRKENGSVTIAISDNGSGIKAKNLNKIFDPFFTTKDVGKGTGLGLNVVYNIINNHQGYIEVDSTLGKGTTFTVFLPIEPVLKNNSSFN